MIILIAPEMIATVLTMLTMPLMIVVLVRYHDSKIP